jgi:uncharacterized phage-like protein YoqJ
MIIAGTGHRPKKLGGYKVDAENRVYAFARETLTRLKPEHVISGMALGWDMALANACVKLGIPFTAAVPFRDQDGRWPNETRIEYKGLLAAAQRVHVVSSGGYAASKMQVRNVWMVDNCNQLLALYDGSSGGTQNCVVYAHEVGREIVNVWPEWQAFEQAGQTNG